MSDLIHDLLLQSARSTPAQEALNCQSTRLDYGALASLVVDFAAGLLKLKLDRSERVAVYLEKRPETVATMFGAAAAGGVFVPINPLLKPDQVAYILRDCNVRILVTSVERLKLLAGILRDCPDLRTTLVVGGRQVPGSASTVGWDDALRAPAETVPH